VPKTLFEPKREEVKGRLRVLHNIEFNNLHIYQILLDSLNEGEWNDWDMRYIWGRWQVQI